MPGLKSIHNRASTSTTFTSFSNHCGKFRRRLLAWYRRHGRHDLPWRGAFDPYGVLVSELMLQQTTVSTVIPYFHRFMKNFPTVRHLARASLDQVLRRWSGLGYYARARHLHAAAGVIVNKHGGILPKERTRVEDLPGVGPYTAGALLSFAYNRAEALVDGNVVRVLARVFGVRGDPKRPVAVKKWWSLARALIPPSGGRHFNSALMDLGASVCRPISPDCPACPLQKICWAFAHQAVDLLPEKSQKSPQKSLRLSAFWIRRPDGAVAIVRRPPGGLWGGLFELPTVGGSVPPARAVDVASSRVRALRPLGTVAHVLSHRRLRVDLWVGIPVGRVPSCWRWASPTELKKWAVSKLTLKLFAVGKMVSSPP